MTPSSTSDTARRLAAARDLLAVLAFCAAVFYGGRAFINSPYLQKERVTQREAAADIEIFFRQLRETRPAPAAGEKAPDLEVLKADARAQTDARLDEFRRVSVRDLAFILYRSAAAFGDSETRLTWQLPRKYKDPALKLPPFTTAYHEDRFVIDRAADPALYGAELLEVNGVRLQEFLRPALERVSAETPRLRAWLFCRDQLFWWEFANLIAQDKPLEVKVRTAGGKVLRKKLAPVTPGEFRRLSARDTALAKMIYAQSRLALLKIPDLASSRSSRRAYDKFFQELKDKKMETLALDLREASSGDAAGADYLLGFFGGWHKGPMQKFSGRTFLLTGPGTGPAAASFAARFRNLKAGEIIGAETGGTPGYIGVPETFTLPASGLKYSVPSRRYPYPAGVPGGVRPDIALTAASLRPFGDIKNLLMKLKAAPVK